MNKVNPEKDELVLELINSGDLVCSEEGQIYLKGREIGFPHNKGYVAIQLWGDERYLIMAHRVIWLYFKGPIPEGLVPNHIDEIKNNNRLSNLELLTNGENVKHSIRTGSNTFPERQKGSGNSNAKLSDQAISEIRQKYATKEYSVRDLASIYGVSHPTIAKIVKNQTYAA